MTTAKNWVKKLFLLGYNLKSGGADKILVDGLGGGGGCESSSMRKFF